ncbi:hypothetical protein B0H17DRAFT_1162569 [Mycena rosella]|uniref:C3H1-type domain-containing protein n=1 Tax=Mycena rosella TaxID=1033263 RepID=A0AAD7CZR8_MYCRO|nr:hypothetical protein B0H17DRAFT_1162569 [Mycena rosella]
MSSLADVPAANSDGTNRWRFNNNGQLVASEAESAEWDLADEIVRLKIGEVAGEAAEDIPIRTPPKSKLASAQLTETSPLDTASIPSVNSSPLASDHIGASHSRGSSTDTTVSSSQDSVASNTMMAPAHVKLESANDVKERPHSFSGGLSSADLRRLQQVGDPVGAEVQEPPFQQQQWSSIQFRDTDRQFASEQPAYPSLAAHGAAVHRPPQGPHPQLYDYRTGAPQNAPDRNDLQIDYNIQQRNFNPLPQGANVAVPPAFIPGRPNNAVPGMPYRQPPPPRGFPHQGLLPSPTALGYPGAHAPHLSLGNTQQLYEMMLPGHENHHPAVSRVQQQHNVFRGAHHHSTSDPSALRDAATLALLNSNMQAFANNMFPQGMAPPPAPMPMYPNQFYAAQEAYGRLDVATAQAMAARLQPQYTGPYGGMPPSMGMTDGSLSPSSTNGQGPSANNRKLGLYKTELCRSWEEKGTCRYAGKCQFAHGEDELRNVSRHPKYKTEICRTFWVSGSCPYGKRCCFIHTELPPSGAAGEAAPPPPRTDGRARSLSTNSDPNEGSVSLLARIAKREPNNAPTPTEVSPSSGFQFTRPPTGSLRVDTSVEGASLKQNKSAYPSFASNGVLIHAPERLAAKSPAPVTAGPDLGRHNNSRLEIVGYNQRTTKAPTPSNSSVRHSFNGSEGDVNFSSSPPSTGHSPFTLPSGDSTSSVGRTNGHVRAGSAGNWGSFSRSSHLTTAYGQSSPSTEAAANSPWSTTELAVGSSRLHEKAWA